LSRPAEQGAWAADKAPPPLNSVALARKKALGKNSGARAAFFAPALGRGVALRSAPPPVRPAPVTLAPAMQVWWAARTRYGHPWPGMRATGE